MKRIAIALAALALILPEAMAQSGGGSGGSGGSSGSGGSAGSGSSSGSSSSAGSGSSSGASGVGRGTGLGQSGSGQSGRGGLGGQSDGLSGRAGSLNGDATRSPVGDRPDARIGGQGNPQFGQDRDSSVGTRGQFDRTGRFDQPGQFGTGSGLRDRQFDGRRLDDRGLDAGQRGTRFGDRLSDDQFENDRFRDQGTDRLRGTRSESATGTAGRQQRVRWIAGRWWFQRDSGSWLTWDPQASEWQNFDPRVLEQSRR